MRETIRWASAQKRIQVGKFPSLPFVAHPNFFLRIPESRSVKKEEGVSFEAFVFFVQRLNSLLGELQQGAVFRKRFLGCVPEIRQQTKMKVLVPIGSSMDSTLVIIEGITARARDSCGIPLEKSIRGNGRGAESKVADQFAMAIAG